jgi:hypothetical protein
MLNRRHIAVAAIAVAASIGGVVTAPTAAAYCVKIRQHVTCTFTETTLGPGPHKNWTQTTTTTTTLTTLGNPNNTPQSDTSISSSSTVNNPAGKQPPGQQ